MPAEFSVSGQIELLDKWWEAFADADLNALIEQAMDENFTLRVAWARLDQARATAAKSGAGRWPSLGGNAEGRRRLTETRTGGTGVRRYGTTYGLGLAASYEVDLWGRVKSAHDAARLDTDASAADLRAAAMTLSADIARVWFTLCERRAQLGIASEQIQVNEDSLSAIAQRFRQGQAVASDVLQQRQLVAANRGTRIQLDAEVDVLVHQLAVLTGQPPTVAVAPGRETLPELPPLPELGIPLERLGSRPDLRAAAARVRAADRRVASALADRFPRLSLTAQTETSAEQVRDLFENWLVNVAANAVVPILDGGQRRAEVRRTEAVAVEAVSNFGQAWLSALREVEDALTLESGQAKYLDSLSQQLALSNAATERIRARYMQTGNDFVRYLSTLVSNQDLQRRCLTAQRQLLEERIDLYRAVGSGWELVRPGARRAEPTTPGPDAKGLEDVP